MKTFLCLIALLIFSSPIVTAKTVEITEVFPNPKGSDKGIEYIELFNHTNKTIDLKDWKIGNSRKYKIKNTIISPQSFNSITGVPLKNGNNYLELLNPQKQIIDSMTYKNVIEDKSYSKDQNSWSWTTPTKNKTNNTITEITTETFQVTPPSTITINKTTNISFKNNIPLTLVQLILKNSKSIKIKFDNNQQLIKLSPELLKTKNTIYQQKTTQQNYAGTIAVALIPFLLTALIYLYRIR